MVCFLPPSPRRSGWMGPPGEILPFLPPLKARGCLLADPLINPFDDSPNLTAMITTHLLRSQPKVRRAVACTILLPSSRIHLRFRFSSRRVWRIALNTPPSGNCMLAPRLMLVSRVTGSSFEAFSHFYP